MRLVDGTGRDTRKTYVQNALARKNKHDEIRKDSMLKKTDDEIRNNYVVGKLYQQKQTDDRQSLHEPPASKSGTPYDLSTMAFLVEI